MNRLWSDEIRWKRWRFRPPLVCRRSDTAWWFRATWVPKSNTNRYCYSRQQRTTLKLQECRHCHSGHCNRCRHMLMRLKKSIGCEPISIYEEAMRIATTRGTFKLQECPTRWFLNLNPAYLRAEEATERLTNSGPCMPKKQQNAWWFWSLRPMSALSRWRAFQITGAPGEHDKWRVLQLQECTHKILSYTKAHMPLTGVPGSKWYERKALFWAYATWNCNCFWFWYCYWNELNWYCFLYELIEQQQWYIDWHWSSLNSHPKQSSECLQECVGESAFTHQDMCAPTRKSIQNSDVRIHWHHINHSITTSL